MHFALHHITGKQWQRSVSVIYSLAKEIMITRFMVNGFLIRYWRDVAV